MPVKKLFEDSSQCRTQLEKMRTKGTTHLPLQATRGASFHIESSFGSVEFQVTIIDKMTRRARNQLSKSDFMSVFENLKNTNKNLKIFRQKQQTQKMKSIVFFVATLLTGHVLADDMCPFNVKQGQGYQDSNPLKVIGSSSVSDCCHACSQKRSV